jgi:PhnB protein
MFNGNAREAIDFYTPALGGEVTFVQKYSEAPGDYPKDSATNDLIMHANIKWEGFELMISDAHPARTVTFGEAINISISIAGKEEGQKVFDALSVGGTVDMPFADQFWGATFGSFTDKFGVSWMVNAEQK